MEPLSFSPVDPSLPAVIVIRATGIRNSLVEVPIIVSSDAMFERSYSLSMQETIPGNIRMDSRSFFIQCLV